MIKYDELVKEKHRTMYFYKMKLTKDEIYNLYYYGHCLPSWLRLVVINVDDVDAIIDQYKSLRPNKKDGFKYLVDKYVDMKDEVMNDLISFSKGLLDLQDLSVKYGFYYYDLKKAFSIILGKNIDNEWRKHKKYVQKKTCKQIYGVESATLDKDVINKRETTMLERYGVKNPMHVEEFKNKLKSTNLSRYGVSSNLYFDGLSSNWSEMFFETLSSDSKWSNTFKYLDINDSYALISKFQIYKRDFIYSEMVNYDNLCILLSTYKIVNKSALNYPNDILFSFDTDINKSWVLHFCELGLIDADINILNSSISKYEIKIYDLLKSLGIEFKRNYRKLLGDKEVDFYIESKNIAIEVNPSISHNSNLYCINPLRNIFNTTKDKYYHYNKYKACVEKGVILISLYEWDFDPLRFESLTKPRLIQLLNGFDRVYGARECEIIKVNKNEIKDCRLFLDKYHTQKAGRANDYYSIQLKKTNELLGVASFITKNRVELKRLCFKTGVQVIGGLSKVISIFFKDNEDIQVIYSFSDNDIGNGVSYLKSGAEFIKETGPSLKFVSHSDPLDQYTWSIASTWGAKGGVVYKDTFNKNIKTLTNLDEINEYIETNLSHRTDDGSGYDRIYTTGSKLWKFNRK